MKRLLLALAITLCGIVGVGATAQHERVIYVRNVSNTMTDQQVLDDMPAWQEAIDKDFAPVWHERARLVFIGHRQAPKGSWRIRIVDYPDCWGCAGWHSFQDGHPIGEVAAATGDDVSLVFTHELWEMLVDPYVHDDGAHARMVSVGTDRYVVETADPVEAERFAYWRTSLSGKPVVISDFVTPAWFIAGSTGLWDFTGSCRQPLEILEDGYQLVLRNGNIITLPERPDGS